MVHRPRLCLPSSAGISTQLSSDHWTELPSAFLRIHPTASQYCLVRNAFQGFSLQSVAAVATNILPEKATVEDITELLRSALVAGTTTPEAIMQAVRKSAA